MIVAEVLLWGQQVGAVAEAPDGQITFEFAESFRRSGREISPIHLPLSLRGPVSFPALSPLESFEGLPGVLADALPDRFGNAVIRRWFEQQGRPDDALSPVQKLLYVGDRAMGALSFRPGHAVDVGTEEALQLAELVVAARQVIEGSPDVVVPEIMRVAASAGGARAKAVVLWNGSRIRSGFASPEDDDEHWLIKFDGAGDIEEPHRAARPYNRVEFAYHRLARRAGIEMADCALIRDGALAHFITRRFDRNGADPHVHSLGGMTHTDFHQPGLYSYEQLFRLVLRLGGDPASLEEAFRRAVFNLLARNQDDHVKNTAFLLERDGRWRLSPAYDLTYARGRGFTRVHQMSFAGKRDGFEVRDLLAVGERFGLRRSGRGVIEQVAEALSHWPEEAREAGVAKDLVGRVGGEFRWDLATN
jgi:serine/threonine-protein kinase HipA